jgi:hypothetical protein
METLFPEGHQSSDDLLKDATSRGYTLGATVKGPVSKAEITALFVCRPEEGIQEGTPLFNSSEAVKDKARKSNAPFVWARYGYCASPIDSLKVVTPKNQTNFEYY